MNYFFDTSALVKYFHKETGSDKVTSLINNTDNVIWILDIAGIEFLCALHRRYRNHEITDIELTTAIDGFDESLAAFNIEETGISIMKEAESLVKQYGKTDGLRTLDSLHIAAFSLLADDDWIFVASDNRLSSIIKKLGYTGLNPLEK